VAGAALVAAAALGSAALALRKNSDEKGEAR
jgi:hypothetical protein